MRRTLHLTGIVAAFVLAAAPASAQRGMQPPMPRYDTSTVETIVGTIVRVDTIRAMPGARGAGLHVLVRAGRDTIPVHLGPAAYLASRSVTLAAGAPVTVRGSRVVWQERPVLIAAELRSGKTAVTLRDAQGLPLWRGAGMPGMPGMPGRRMP